MKNNERIRGNILLNDEHVYSLILTHDQKQNNSIFKAWTNENERIHKIDNHIYFYMFNDFIYRVIHTAPHLPHSTHSRRT
jgi:hypothetical protein